MFFTAKDSLTTTVLVRPGLSPNCPSEGPDQGALFSDQWQLTCAWNTPNPEDPQMESQLGLLIPSLSCRHVFANKPAPMAEPLGGLTKTRYKLFVSVLSITVLSNTELWNASDSRGQSNAINQSGHQYDQWSVFYNHRSLNKDERYILNKPFR